MTRSTAPEQRHLALSERFFDEYLMGGIDILDDLVAPDFRGHGFGGHDGELVGADGLRSYFGAALGTSRYDVHERFAAGDTVVTRWTVYTANDMVRGGPSPTGGETEMSGITVERFADGKLAEMWVQADYLHLYRQLGLVSEPVE
ncbi:MULTISPECIES: ester cyclase [unclassified Haladaptatus]|uniref:ester cyclase n=1 Tax=unclassified Haladaptatus TaxID=2622732 RepID=UPI0023E7B3D4|nr:MULTISPECIES: nuclear transport factor 2 family protein [unclassified Haladaptatus]